MSTWQSQLRVPTRHDALPLAGAFLRELVTLARLPVAAAERLVAAATESCADIVGAACGPGEPFEIAATLTPRALTLAIQERGAPFDPTHCGTDDLAPLRSPAWERVRHAVDEARWLNRGTDGMELQLVVHRPGGDVTEHLPESELTPFAHEEPQTPEQPYVVRRAQPDDAIGVAQCVYRSFGYTYGDTDLYYPERIRHLYGTGQLVSVVALDATGTVVGHLGLERPDLGPIAESSDAAVAPAHRHRHLLERLRALAEEDARGLGLVGLVGYPVTTHPYSQRMEEAIHGRLCAVVLGQLPRSTTFTGIADAEPQRVSTLLYFKYLTDPVAAVVHAPPRHRALLERLYANLGAPAAFRDAAAPSGAGRVGVSFDRAWGYGEIGVERIGADTAAEIRRARADLCAVAGTEVVYLYLPLAQPGTPALCADAEADGFFFSGIGPHFAKDGDMLCLQYAPEPLDASRLQIATPFGRELLDYVTAERARVGASG